MQRKPAFWFAICLLCLGGAVYFWQLGDKWEADRQAAAHRLAPTNAPISAIHTPRIAQRPGLLANSGNKSAGTNALVKERFPYRLKNTEESLDKLIHNERGLLLQNALLDTGKRVDLKIPDRLKAPADNGTYLVQAKGALNNDFRAALQMAGATIVSYIPNNAYLVRVSAGGAQQIGASDLTQSVLPYEPYYKLDPKLLAMAMQDPQALPPGGTLNVTLFGDAHQQVLSQLAGLGAMIDSEDRSPFGPVLKVYAAPGSLSTIASLPGVQGVAAWHPRVQANDLTRPRLGVSVDSVTPDNYLGLTGSNVVININDTGVDAAHPDLTNRISTLASELFNLTDPIGHGTHVAGTILGTGTESSTVTNAQGSLTNANFRGMAPNATAFVLSLDDPDSFLQEQAAMTNALISNNSWNYQDSSSYDIAAASYDAAVRDALPTVTGPQPITYVFSAGNAGGGFSSGTGATSDTILSPATAKNVITVGAIEQPRFITNVVVIGGVTNENVFYQFTDSDNQVADFSSRGNVGISVEGSAGRFKPDVVSPGEFVISDRSGDWDTTNYYNPTNFSSVEYFNVRAQTNVLTPVASITLQANTVGVIFTIIPNQDSPTNLMVPIYVAADTQPTLANFVGTNTVALPTNSISFVNGSTLNFSAGNTSTSAVSFNAIMTVITTNDDGFFIALSNLNSSVGPFYRYESGTSMAAAGVSGLLADVEEFFQRMKLTNSPALMKALLINGSRSLDGELYDFSTSAVNGNSQGWGLPNLANIVTATTTNIAGNATSISNTPLVFFDQNPTNVLATGQSATQVLSVSPDGQNQDLRITLVWTDPPGNPTAGTKLVNDLDLIVTNLDTGEVFYGNDIPGGSIYTESYFPGDPPIIDSVNNVENVFLQQPVGSSYSITVYGRRVNVNAVTGNTNDIVQDYAMVISSGDAAGATDAFLGITNSNPTGPVNIGISNVYIVSNAVPLFNQRVGANSQYTGTTNGNGEQWNFYIYTNTPSLTNNDFTNVAILTFLPPNLGVPVGGASAEVGPPDTNATRFNGADIDLYVSTLPGLTNLDPAVLATAYSSTTRSGTEKVLITNSTAGEVFYIGVRAQDQQAAQFDLFAVATDLPFDQTDANGNTLVTILTPLPIAIPPGPPNNPNQALILGVTTSTIEVRKAVVTNTVIHQEFGDLIGTLTHQRLASPTTAVLNNHTFFVNPGDAFETFIYDDSGENDIPGSRTSDGPGTLRNFAGDSASQGIWMFTEVNDSSLTDLGSVSNFSIYLEPEPPVGSRFNITIQGNSWFYGVVPVPANATNLTVTLFSFSQPLNLDLYIRAGDFPSQTLYDEFAVIGPSGGSLSVSKFSSPPLNAGTYYYGIYNPNAQAISLAVEVDLGLSVTPVQSHNFFSVGDEPIKDDALTYSTNMVTVDSFVSSVEVGVRIDHPRESDLVLTLISPDGTRVLLSENRGGEDTHGYGSGVDITNYFGAVSSGNLMSATNIIPITQSAGTLEVKYDFEQISDDMRIYYGTQLLLDTGLINGAGNFSVDFGPGSATSLTIIMNQPGTNPGTDTNDVWSYTPTIITRELVYATFTEDTNKTIIPIKFAIPPFGPPTPFIPATNILTTSFEGIAAGVYPGGSIVAGWTDQSTNPVTIVTVPNLADTGSNVLALHGGAISRSFPTIVGTSYTLAFASHGRPNLAPVSWWKGDANDTVHVAHDSWGTNDGLYLNNATNVTGLVNNAFAFNGINQHARVPDSVSLHFTNALTTENWVNLSNHNGSTLYGDSMIEKYDAPGNNGNSAFSFGITLPGGFPYMIISTNGGTGSGSGATIISSAALPLNIWTHVASTYDGTNLQIYVNGVPTGSTPLTGFIHAGSDDIGLGANVGGLPSGQVAAPLPGYLDEAALYDIPLNIVQIQDIYAAGSAGKVVKGGDPLVHSTLIIGTLTNQFSAGDAWTTNFYTFIATTNSIELTFASQTNGDGMLLDSIVLAQNATLSQSNYFLPEEPMDKLIGQKSKGAWQLEVLDNRAGATNPPPSLISWELSLVVDDLEPAATPLIHAIPQTNTIGPNAVTYYKVVVPPWASYATNSITINPPGGSVNLIFNQTELPLNGGNDVNLLAPTTGTGGFVTLSNSPSAGPLPQLVPGQTYYLAVQNTSATASVNFTIEVDFNIIQLTNAIGYTNTMLAGPVPQYYQFDVDSNAIAVSFELIYPGNNLQMVIKKGAPLPDQVTYDYTTNSRSVIVLTNSTPVPVGPGRWYIGIFNVSNPSIAIPYEVRATEAFPPTIILLTNGMPFSFNSPSGPALTNFFEFSITNNPIATNNPKALLFELYTLSGNVDLDVDREQIPYMPPYFAFSANPSTNREQVVVRTNLIGTNIVGNWFLGVPNNELFPVTYIVRAVVSTNNLLISGVPPNATVTLPPHGATVGPTLTIPAVSGELYQFQYTSDFVTWINIGSPVIALNEFASIVDPNPIVGTRFYRVIQEPNPAD